MRLIDADALKKEWRMGNKCEECERNARDCNYYDFISRMDVCSMLDDAPTVGGWISVKDRLPEHGKRYLIYATSGDNKIGYITTVAFGGHFVLSGRRAYWKVTHWMPLPPGPEENNDDA